VREEGRHHRNLQAIERADVEQACPAARSRRHQRDNRQGHLGQNIDEQRHGSPPQHGRRLSAHASAGIGLPAARHVPEGFASDKSQPCLVCLAVL
jgi:hypothetical protein